MKTCLTLITLLCLVSCTKEPQVVKDLPIMGNLELGIHPVGFQSLFLYDRSRPGIPFSDWDGKLRQDHDTTKGRQYQINLWYPAIGNTGKKIKYEHYVDLMGRQTNFANTELQKQFARETFISQTNDLGADRSFTKEKLTKLLELQSLGPLGGRSTIGTISRGGIPQWKQSRFSKHYV